LVAVGAAFVVPAVDAVFVEAVAPDESAVRRAASEAARESVLLSPVIFGAG
jgi:hypothetical protein